MIPKCLECGEEMNFDPNDRMWDCWPCKESIPSVVIKWIKIFATKYPDLSQRVRERWLGEKIGEWPARKCPVCGYHGPLISATRTDGEIEVFCDKCGWHMPNLGPGPTTTVETRNPEELSWVAAENKNKDRKEGYPTLDSVRAGQAIKNMESVIPHNCGYPDCPGPWWPHCREKV